MTSLRERWNRFWFEAVSPDNLGLCRIVLFGTMFLFYVLAPGFFPAWGYRENFVPWGSVSRVFWSPVWLFSVLHLPAASVQVLEVMQCVWRAALLLSCVGLFTRISTAISFVFGLYLFGVPASFGRIHHMEHVLIFSFLIMAFSRCGDAWSLDAFIDAFIRKGTGGANRAPALASGEYTWPVRMIWVVIAATYFAAGVSKVRHSGFEWITSDTMRNFLMAHAYHISVSEPLTSWGPVLARGFVIPRFLAATGIIVELALPLALFSRRARWVLVPSAAAMQFGVAVLLGPNFYQIILCQLLWVPWDRVVAWVTEPRLASEKSWVDFDEPPELHAIPAIADKALEEEPSVTIVVVARERFSYSRRSLEHVYANTEGPFHLIYVDGGSPERNRRSLEKQASKKGFRLIRTDHYLSPNQARNLALREAKTKYVAFIDNDVEVTLGWLTALVQCAEETNASLVGPLYCIGQPVHQVIHMAGGDATIREIDGRRRLYEKMRFCDQRVNEVLPQLHRESRELLEFHCLLARRQVFQTLGPLDEALLGTRDHVDLCLMVRDAGGSVWFEPKAIVSHAPDSIWPEVPAPFAWMDIPYYLLRWSDDWGASSLRHFEKKWNLDASTAELTRDWLRPHRQVPLRKFRARLHRVLGASVGDRLVDALEESLARRASQKGHRSQRPVGHDAHAVQS